MHRSLVARVFTPVLLIALAIGPASLSGPAPVRGIDLCTTTYYCGYLDIVVKGDGEGAMKAGPNDELQCTYSSGAMHPSPCKLQFSWPHSAGLVEVVPYTFTATAVSSKGCDGWTHCSATWLTETATAIVYNTATTTLTASFWLNRFSVTVAKTGTGTGSLSFSQYSCGPACLFTNVPYGTSETFSAVADPGSVFDGWTGACNGQGPTCTFVVQGDAAANVIFDTIPASPTPKPTSGHTAPPTATPAATARATHQAPGPSPSAEPPASAGASESAGASAAASPGPNESANTGPTPAPEGTAGLVSPVAASPGIDGVPVIVVVLLGIIVLLLGAVLGLLVAGRRGAR